MSRWIYLGDTVKKPHLRGASGCVCWRLEMSLPYHFVNTSNFIKLGRVTHLLTHSLTYIIIRRFPISDSPQSYTSMKALDITLL